MLFPKGTAYSVVPTRNEAAVASLVSAISIDDKLPNFTITASQALSCKPMVWRAKGSLFGIFFCRRMVRTPAIISLAFSTAASRFSSVVPDSGMRSIMMLSPSLRS